MTLEEIVDAAGEYAAQFDPGLWSGDHAARLAEVAAMGEHLMATVKVLAARKAASTGCWARSSGAASAEQWLATISGTSEGAAREQLLTASRLDALPDTAQAMRSGELSVRQAAQVTAAAAVDANAEAHLLEVAGRAGMRELREEKERVITAASDEVRAHELAVRERHLRVWTRGLATHGSFSGPTEQVAVILAALKPLERKRFDAGRAKAEHESQDAYRFDGLVDLATGNAPATSAKRAEPVTRLRVGLSRLLGGDPVPGEEMCEIPGGRCRLRTPAAHSPMGCSSWSSAMASTSRRSSPGPATSRSGSRSPWRNATTSVARSASVRARSEPNATTSNPSANTASPATASWATSALTTTTS
jgi:hypothetical protein